MCYIDILPTFREKILSRVQKLKYRKPFWMQCTIFMTSLKAMYVIILHSRSYALNISRYKISVPYAKKFFPRSFVSNMIEFDLLHNQKFL